MANVCDRFCKNCMYANTLGNGTIACNYFLTTNIRRPCKAGTGCTVKKIGKKIGAWKYENDAQWGRKMYEARLAKAVQRTAICQECGIEFETTNVNKIYCSKRCNCRINQRRYWERQRIAEQGNE